MTQSAGTLLLQTPRPHLSSSSQSAHQLTNSMSGQAKVTPVCTRALRFLLHFPEFSVLSAWTEKKNGWTGGRFFLSPAAHPAWLQKRPETPFEKILRLNRILNDGSVTDQSSITPVDFVAVWSLPTFSSSSRDSSCRRFFVQYFWILNTLSVAINWRTDSWAAGWSERHVCVRVCGRVHALSAAVGWHHLCNGTLAQTDGRPQLFQSQPVIAIISLRGDNRSLHTEHLVITLPVTHTYTHMHVQKNSGLIIEDLHVQCCCEME